MRHSPQLRSIGNKAQGLTRLTRLGLRVPTTYVCQWEAYEKWLSQDPNLERDLKEELAFTLNLSTSFAVRSSANIEDGPLHSFAGQFESVLAVRGVNALWEAICHVWASACGPKANTYRDAMDRAGKELKMAVIIQEMVTSHSAGVAFSRNPMTGMDEVVVEAVRGCGEALVQEGLTPERWVDKWGEWIVRPVQTDVPASALREIVAGTRTVAKAWQKPVDMEWVYDGYTVYWVQARAITSLSNLALYSNRIAREVLPGQIKPLVWSVNVPLVNSAWVNLFTEVIGPNSIDPSQLAQAFYYRAYFNMSVIGDFFTLLGMPRDSLELLLGLDLACPAKPSFRPTPKTLIHTPHLMRFVYDKWRFDRRVDKFVPRAKAEFEAIARADLRSMDESALFEQINNLMAVTNETAYYNIVVPLLMQLYSRLLERMLRSNGNDPASVDVTKGLTALDDLNPNVHLAKLNKHFLSLDPSVQAEIRQGTNHSTQTSETAASFQYALDEFIHRFGHLSDSGNDFSATPWRENPAFVIKMATATPPSTTDGCPSVGVDELDLPWVLRPLFGMLHRRVRRYRLYREQISSLYTFGYGLFRDYFHRLGDHMVERGVLTDRNDIFYLYIDELTTIMSSGDDGNAMANVDRRRQEMDAYHDISLPDVIYGDEPPPPERPAVDNLTGMPTARGYYQGAVCVVRGSQDFDKVEEGNVLVIPYSDVGWTPLFSKAGAIVAESGGMLSHSSIVAREYRIPAVVSVNGVCQLPDGVVVTVDGYSGRIMVHDREEF